MIYEINSLKKDWNVLVLQNKNALKIMENLGINTLFFFFYLHQLESLL